VNGAPKDDAAFVRQMGYVEQFGVHSAASTVLESLAFSAALRLPAGTPASQRDALVEEVLSLLELHLIRDKLVGAPSVSCEEMKRVTIGVEMVANPAVLFRDEPTSGLDARAAPIGMSGMRKAAQTGRASVCTIHQPSAAIVQLFDALLLMKRGGQAVFFGPLGANAANLKAYFEDIPGVLPCGPDANPATWMLEVIGAGTASARAGAMDFAAEYSSSALALANEREVHALCGGDGGGRVAAAGAPRGGLLRRGWVLYGIISVSQLSGNALRR